MENSDSSDSEKDENGECSQSRETQNSDTQESEKDENGEPSQSRKMQNSDTPESEKDDNGECSQSNEMRNSDTTDSEKDDNDECSQSKEMQISDPSNVENENNGECSRPKKLHRTVPSMIKCMKMTKEEVQYRVDNFEKIDVIEEYKKYLKCTICDLKFLEKIKRGEEVPIHPFLLVIMCEGCKTYYGDGNFSLDSDGEDKYCRWCGEGGTIFSCSKCICGFCDGCVKKHFGEEERRRVAKDDNWICYFCDPKPLWLLRSVCSLAWQASKTRREQLGKLTVTLRKRKKCRDSSEKDNDDSFSSDTSYSIVSEKEKSDKKKKNSKTKKNTKKSTLPTGAVQTDALPTGAAPTDTLPTGEDDEGNSGRKTKRLKKKKTSSESDTATRKKQKISDDDPEFENKKTLVLNKLKSIWRLTQTIASVGMSLSKKRLKKLEERDSFKNVGDLQNEHDDLKSFTATLISSLNSASASVDSFKEEDMSFDDATDETEILQAKEMEIKKLAKKLERKSDGETSTVSDSEDSSKNESKKKTNKPEQSKNEEENGKEEGDEKTEKREGVKPSADLDNSKSLFSDSKCEEVKENNASNDSEKRENSEPRRPLLRVKAFARMLDENILNKKVVEVYDIASDKSEDECEKRLDLVKTTNSEVTEKIQNKENNVNQPCEVEPEKNKQKSQTEKKTDKVPQKQRNKKSNPNASDVEVTGRGNGANNKFAREKKVANTADTDSSDDEVLANRITKTKDLPENESEEKKKSLNGKKIQKNKQKSDQESSDESIIGKRTRRRRRKKKPSDDGSESSDEEPTVRKTRSHKKGNQNNQVSKSLFEKYKQKRENFIKSRMESFLNDKSKDANDTAAKLSEDSEKEEDQKSVKQKKKLIIESSEEEEQNKSEKAKESEVKISTSEEESEIEVRRRPVRRKKKKSDSSVEETKKSKKTGKDSSDSSEEEQKKKKGRRNINKILKKDSLKVETKEALKNEEARRKRVKERQKLFEKLFPEDNGKIILDFDPEKKEPLVTVHKKLAKKLKPHQVKGVKFMWDNCFESVQRLEEDSGTGCILAHCMGLGKTLQVITLVHTVMNHDLGVRTVLIVCPLSTVSNWIREFESWLGDINTDPIMLYDLVKYKKREERSFHLNDWHENGGVLVISYDMFRMLTKMGPKKERKTKYKQTIETALLDPGPDLVVCDEGHLLKNEDTALSKCISRIKTSRRIVLTGTPLQNNLVEYHCMVQFVKPNILGTKKEFMNRFVNPINNGQFEDSTELDVKIMKRRSHVLHSMLEGAIQRYDYSVLTPFLPEKHEYVIAISVTEKQAKAYRHFLATLSAKSQGSLKGRALFHDYHNLQRIWTHPRVILMQSERETEREFMKDEEDSLKDFIVSSGEESETGGSDSSDLIEEVQPKKRILRSNANDPEVIKAMEEEREKSQVKHWWDEFFDEDSFSDLRESNKLILLFSLLKRCKEVGDKILVFSQSLYSLDLIEYFLNEINENGKKNNERLCGYRDTWHLGTDYFRLDGSTTSDQRAAWCKHFNKESNTRARLFLISTRAGGLGINLYGANRVVILDASWNPSHDLQSIFRVYRFGQKKPCFIYRFLAEGTMEEKIYERQVTKLSLAHRVVDEHQIERHYTMGNLLELYEFRPTEERSIPNVPKDSILADLLQEYKEIIVGYHEHDSLLENKEEEELTEEERKAAWKEYEDEKERKMTFTVDPNFQQQQQQQQQQYLLRIQQAYPNQPVRLLNPAFVSMNLSPGFLNPMTNVPLDILERGVRVGVTPLPNESADSYITRVVTRETWIQSKLAGN